MARGTSKLATLKITVCGEINLQSPACINVLSSAKQSKGMEIVGIKRTARYL